MDTRAELYAAVLGIRSPWSVTGVQLLAEQEEVRVRIALSPEATLHCPQCREASPRFDTRERTWRHLDTCQFKTFLTAEIPRVKCREHGIHQIHVPWSEPGSRFTALFESVVIDWLHEGSMRTVARLMDLSWDEVDGIQHRAVRRGLARRKLKAPRRIGIDETSFCKRHEYVTIVTDLDSATVLHVADDRKKASLDGFFAALSSQEKQQIEVVAMDMWEAYIASVREHIPDAEKKVAFDKFHVASHLGEAVNEVRHEEHQRLLSRDDERLKGTKYLWLQNPDRMDAKKWRSFEALRTSSLKTAKAWSMKETAMGLWHYVSRTIANRNWRAWAAWVLRSRLEPMKRVARMVLAHLEGVVTAVVTAAHNARAEGINNVIQWLKRIAFGFRNRERFRRAILFHLGGLDLYPRPAS